MIKQLIKGLGEVVVMTLMLLAMALPLVMWKVTHNPVPVRKLDPILVPAPAYEEMEPVRFPGDTTPIYYKRFYP